MKSKNTKTSLVKRFKLENLQKRAIFVSAIVIFIVINLLVVYLPVRLDLSTGKAHTLSSSTKKIVSRLDKKTSINVYISSDLPLRLLPLKTDVVDLVREYERQSNGKITTKLRDPKKDEAALKEAQEAGIPELQFSQVEQDKYAVSSTYFGIALQQGDKKEVIPQATSLESLEYDITSAIYKMTQKEPVRVGIIGGAGNPLIPQQDEFATFKQILNQQFLLSNINTSSEAAGLKTVLVFDDGREYKTEDTNEFKKYIDSGGKMVFVVDGVAIGEGLQTTPVNHNLFPFFNSYGITLNKNLVLSAVSEIANFSTGSTAFLTPYPFWVKTSNFDTSISELSSIGVLTFAWTASIDTKKTANGNVQVLVKSEPDSWIQKDSFVLSPNEIPPPNQNDLKEYSLVAEYTGKNGGQFVVIPSSRFVKEQFLSRSNGNVSFLLNILSSYASGGALSGIRSRSLSIYPLKNIPENTKDILKYLIIFLTPGIFAIYGGYRLLKRK